MTAYSAAATKRDTPDFATDRCDLHAVEEASFVTIVRGNTTAAESKENSEQRMPRDDSPIAIFAAPSSQGHARPNAGYWLFVVVAAISAFWVAGGHALFVGQ